MNLIFELGRAQRLREDIEKMIIVEKREITAYKSLEGKKKDGHVCAIDGQWKDYVMGTAWNQVDAHRWFRTTITIPESMDGKHVEFLITTGREGEWDATNPQMIFYLDGQLIQGIDVNHREVTISGKAKAGDSYEIAVLAYSGMVEGDLVIHTYLIAVDDRVQKLYYDLLIPLQSAYVLKKADEENYRRVLQSMAPALDALDLRDAYSEKFYSSIEKAEQILKEAFYSEERECPTVSAIGHTHIDIAWLWTVEQTREKVLRSFSTVLRLMEQYPDYKFMSSQPILYQFVKEQEPEMYEKIKERIREGRWEVDGAMWLEADCNLAGGESLVRQIIKGHRFFLEEFGKESKSLWLPDVFGYSAALPQILKKSGIPYFMTTKIAWNQYDQLPNDTFIWKGIDGSEVFAFMPTTTDYDKDQGLNISFSDTRNTTTYTGIVNPNMALGTFKRFQNRDLTEDTLMLFGFGDGGGGPTKEMLESAERLKYGIPGIPKIRQEFEQDYFDRTYEKIHDLPDMPTWDGELYFEYHRGTLTSMARNKRSNRKNEILYTQMETASCMAGIEKDEQLQNVLDKGWDILLINQFHDIVPGSSIKPVYEQTDKEYHEIEEAGKEELNRVVSAAVGRLSMEKEGVVVMNTQGYERDDLVVLDDGTEIPRLVDEDGRNVPAQKTADGRYLLYVSHIPPLGYKKLYETEELLEESTGKEWDYTFENPFIKVCFNEKMEITSLYEKGAEKELIQEGRCGNVLRTYEDRPMQWDNWDIDVFYQRKPYEADWYSPARVVENGEVRMVVEFECGFLDSTVTQQVCLYHQIPRIDFRTKADWKTHHVILKTHFPVDVNTTRASYEIQFGNVERETTNNYSWDTAKFESCGHKWADLSENSSGISLLNDCKYGYGIKKGDMSLTLIKSGTYPNEDADIGEHEFTYSIYPHAGRWQEAKTVEMAYNLNVPMLAKRTGRQEGCGGEYESFLKCSQESCFVEVIKKAEDGNGVIVRMYENKNNRVRAQIQTAYPIAHVYECNLLEENEEELTAGKNCFETVFKPYEIKTFRLIFE
ncbi:alpha-mannosidase [Drancourtella massiliensis]|uniref:Alpha-mannosidase n=1 Tax=Drancourtella massiliensis TaxID=1632013 RepID=A0ABS2EGM3_9FIRM|nr:glycoside hydrolase family 38 C-terminal domain-containing protein [Drancourtella massiliensis]MBM6744108.1 alpha-mannosidase [Drancourtella massiliensis]